MKKALFFFLLALTSVAYCQNPPETVNVGTSPNSGNGDNRRDAFIKLNTNDAAIFDSLYHAPVLFEYMLSDTLVTGTINTDYKIVIPQWLSGYELVSAQLLHGKTTGSATPTALLYRMRGGVEVNMFSTGANYTTNAVINSSYRQLLTGDLLEARCTFGAGTLPYGLWLALKLKRP
jgi:hypothetical protein